MKNFLLGLLIVFVLAIVGLLWKENQLQKHILGETTTKPISVVESMKQKGFTPTSEEEEDVQKLKAAGLDEDQIISIIFERRKILANIESEKTHSMCELSRQEVLSDGFSQGITDISEIKKLAALYDLLCFGETDIEIPEPAPQVIQEDKSSFIRQPTPTIDTSFQDKWEQERKEKCQKEMNEYNTCMNEYNAEMAEYSACLAESNNPDKQLSFLKPYCYKPYKYCPKPFCMY